MTKNQKPLVNIYCDGACKGNPGPGGWAALLTIKKNDKLHEKILQGHETLTTNNRMELTAVLKALETLKKPCKINLYSDSQYVVKGMTEWSENWIKNNWKNGSNKPVINQDLWQILVKIAAKHDIKWFWVKGHAGHPQNELVDQIASAEAKKL